MILQPPGVGDDGVSAPLEQAVAGLSHPGVRAIYLRGGVHRLRRPLVLTAKTGAVTIRACPGEMPVIESPAGEPTVILSGSRNTALIGLTFAGPAAVHVLLDKASDCVVEHNTFVHGAPAILLDHAGRNRITHNVIVGVATGIELKDASDANLVADNVVDGADAPETSGGGIFLHGVRDNRIAHNVVQNAAGFGIGVLNWDDASVNVGNIVEYNLLRNTALGAVDSGAVYVLGRSEVDTGIVIAANVIDGVGSADHHNVGIYLDDSTSGAIVVRNLVRGAGSDAVQIHGGSDNLIENNLLDLGGGRSSGVLFQAAPADTHPLNLQTGNRVVRNIMLSSSPRPRLFVWYDGGDPALSDNFYVLADGAVPADAPVVDSHPVMGDPSLTRTGAGGGYAAVQQAALAIAFRPLDLAGAGIRPWSGRAGP